MKRILIIVALLLCTSCVCQRDIMQKVDKAHMQELNSLPVEFSGYGPVLLVTTDDCCKRGTTCWERLDRIAEVMAPVWFERYPEGEIVFLSNVDDMVRAIAVKEKRQLIVVNEGF